MKIRKLRKLKTRKCDSELTAIVWEVRRSIKSHPEQPLSMIIRHARRLPRFRDRFGIVGDSRQDAKVDELIKVSFYLKKREFRCKQISAKIPLFPKE